MRVPRSHIIIKFLLGMLCVMLACDYYGALGESEAGTVPRKMKPVGVTMTNTMTGQTQQQQRPHVRIEYCTS